MKPRNLISVFQGATAVELTGAVVDKCFVSLKKHEIRNISSFCAIMKSKECTIGHFDGFFVSYTIAQIGKEFDLLRFGNEYVLNIEIKSELKVAKKELKILKQMRENYYYLKFLGKPIRIYTYVENDGFYQYDDKNDDVVKIQSEIVANSMKSQTVDYAVDPDKEFVPSNYLISPFNSTEQFVAGEYFLTSAQQRIKDEIQSELNHCPFMFFCISANAGTGKTLLMYDIAKEQRAIGKKVKIIHCGLLNGGHYKLQNDYNWDIVSIRSISSNKDNIDLNGYDYIFVDESQRIRSPQLQALTEKAIDKKIPMFFSFDTKQYLKSGETLNLSDYLVETYPKIPTSTKKLTNKIRTNKAMSSFITNLMNIGKSHDNLNYNCVTVEYMDDYNVLKSYISFLKTMGWTPITYTTSQHNPDPYDKVAELCERNAHSVIGQEFSKVVLVMDENFQYSEEGKLLVRNSYYSASGMLYQIVTRVVDELKIIVTNNPELYVKLLSIKAMGE